MKMLGETLLFPLTVKHNQPYFARHLVTAATADGYGKVVDSRKPLFGA
jgi:hypothetical protein